MLPVCSENIYQFGGFCFLGALRAVYAAGGLIRLRNLRACSAVDGWGIDASGS